MFEFKEGCTFSSLNDIKNKKITVMGLGLNGGGEASVRFFLKHGAFVTVTDMKTKEQLLPTIERLENDKTIDTSRLSYVLGEHQISDFRDADCIIKNPGVKIEGNQFLAEAKNIETDISIFLHFTKSPIIAVTGSKGKSSTVSAIHYGLNKAGFKCFLGGNITVSPLTFLEETTEKTPVVLELSSWQLADLRGRKALKPFISIITKIVPDHQNWYHSMENYVADKRLIYKDQGPDDYTILDFDGDQKEYAPKDFSSWGKLFASETKAKVLWYSKQDLSQKILQKDFNFSGVFQQKKENLTVGKVFLPELKEPLEIMNELSVPGEHMKTNVLNAALVLYLMKVPSQKIIQILKDFPGIPHRLQYFHTYKNTKFYNDSCATVPEAAVCATESFSTPVILITGGTDKGLSFSPLIDHLTDSEKNAKTIKQLFFLDGTGTQKIIPELKNKSVSFNGPFSNLEDCISSVKKYVDSLGNSQNIVVFSPGATSFGMFTNEFDRGNKFMESVKRIFI